ncbi:MAG: serine/threonine protein kinase [Verrucomicrobia bacterium]|nr:serine/threonine protein kinase [Verrucomicrobiota bacterium]
MNPLPSGGSAPEPELEVSALGAPGPNEPQAQIQDAAVWREQLGQHQSKYELIAQLGQGGMGIVFRARALGSDREVAIKLLKPHLATDQRARAFFLKEGRHLQALEHPHIVPAIECGEVNGACWLVMPYLGGGSLSASLAARRPLDPATVVSIARQVAEALAFAHSRGIIHRDLKPSNILIDSAGQLRLADFGLAQTLYNDELADPRACHVEGTPQYLSPTAARGEAEDTRGDIYAFGALLYQMLTGRPPYTGASRQEVLDPIRAGPPAPILEIAPAASPHLAAIAQGAMARDLQERYVHISYVLEDLVRVAHNQPPLGPRGQPTADARKRRHALASNLVRLPLALLIVASATVAAVFALRPAKSSGFRLVRTVETPGVWDWSKAVIAYRGNQKDPFFFAASGQDLLRLSREGERLPGWTLPRQEGELLRPHLPADYLAGGSDQVLASWRYGTNLFIALLNQNIYPVTTYRAAGAAEETATGLEARSDLQPLMVVDLDRDGRRELLARVTTGHEPHYSPRGILCFDFASGELRWQHLTGGAVTALVTLNLDGDDPLEIVYGTDAIKNGNVAPDGTDDFASYIGALDSNGSPLWILKLGGPYTRVFPVLASLGTNRTPALLAWLTGAFDHWPQLNQPEIGPVFRIDAQGAIAVKYEAGCYLTGCLAADLDADGRSEVYVADRHGTLRVLDRTHRWSRPRLEDAAPRPRPADGT